MDYENIKRYHKQMVKNCNQNVRKANVKYYRLLTAEFVTSFLAGFGLALSIIVKENLYVQRGDEEQVVGYLYYNFICTLLLCLSIYARYNLLLSWLKSRQLEFEFETIFSAGWGWKLSIEIFVALLSPLPWI
jgi:hypothetical protein